MQLPGASDPPHTPSPDAGLSTDACMQPDSLKNRLLQLYAVQRSVRQHSEAQASPEQRGTYRSTIIIIIISIFVWRHKVVTSEVLAAVGCVC